MANSEDDDHETVVDTDNARSGVTGHHVRYVLAFGLAGIIVAITLVALLS